MITVGVLTLSWGPRLLWQAYGLQIKLGQYDIQRLPA